MPEEKDLEYDALDEQLLVSRYCLKRCADAHRRVGANVFAYQLVLRARRCCRLYKMGAPAVILRAEERCLAAAMALHAFGKCVE